MKKIVLYGLMLCLLANYVIAGPSVAMVYSSRTRDFGDVERGQIYNNAKMGFQPFYCPDKLYVEISSDTGYIKPIIENGWYNCNEHIWFNLELQVPTDIELGEHQVKICSRNAAPPNCENCMGIRTGACVNSYYNVIDNKELEVIVPTIDEPLCNEKCEYWKSRIDKANSRIQRYQDLLKKWADRLLEYEKKLEDSIID